MTSTGIDQPATNIGGFLVDGFEPVRDTFAAHFEQGLELGASCAVTVDGQFVVDIWAGHADTGGRPWGRDTITNTFSVTKTMAAMCLLVLADRGVLKLSAPVARYWPEFAANGKDAITVSHVLSHTSGLSGFDPAIPGVDFLYDWDACCTQLAGQAPWWEPGTASGYHAVTQGYLVGEIVRRVTGSSLGTFFQREIAKPLGADFHIGLAEEHEYRVAELIPPRVDLGENTTAGDPDSIAVRTGASSRIGGEVANTRDWRSAELPAIGGIGNARSVARIHSAMACGGTVDGVVLLSEAGVEAALDIQSTGVDLVNGVDLTWGNGFAINSESTPISPNPRAIFWAGWGGSFSVIDLDARVSVAYVMNNMADDPNTDFRGGTLAAVALSCAT